MQTFIWNSENSTMARVLETELGRATRVDVAMAFLKRSGFDSLKEQITQALERGCKFRIVVGTDFWQTEPAPLDWMERQFHSFPACELFLVDQQSGSGFHPKIYMIESLGSTTLIVGSSNLTSGGLSKNWEGDLVVHLDNQDPLLRQSRELFNKIIKSGRAKLANPSIVGEYEKQHRIHRKYLDSAIKRAEQKAKREAGKTVQLDDQKLRVLLKRYLADTKEGTDFERRRHNYGVAREHLDTIASEQTKSKKAFKLHFLPLVAGSAKEGAFHSGGLFRSKNYVISQWREFQKVVRFVKSRPEFEPMMLFDQGKKRTNKIFGLGVNILTEIMNTYYPDRCAVLNNNPRSSLEALGATRYPQPNNFTPKDYERFVSDIEYIKRIANFGSMGQADHFLNYIYWRVVKTNADLALGLNLTN